jgi:hypothetical protein
VDPTQKAGVEASRVLDALAAISVQLACHAKQPPHMLVLSAGQVRNTCDAIDEAVTSLKKILLIAASERDRPANDD